MNVTAQVYPSIGIIGGGWFGKAFAKHMINAGNQKLVLTTQTATKLAEFNDIGVNGECLTLPCDEAEACTLSVFSQDVLIIAIPPGFKKGRTDYASNVAQIVRLAGKGQVKQLILLNSTAIYNGHSGDVNETTPLNSSAAKVELLEKAEAEIFKFSKASCSFRLAGLVGEDRHPGRFIARAVADNRQLPEPNAYVNLIHQHDVIGLVKTIIKAQASGVFNGVSATHITKKEYYTLAAQCLSLAAPSFEQSTALPEHSKRVTDQFTRATLKYNYKYDDLIVWLNEK